MKTLSLLIITICCFSCQPKNKEKININPIAKKLNDSAVDLAMANQLDKAIIILDEATRADSNYFIAYINKLNFQSSVKPFNKEKVLQILVKLRSLKPGDPQFPMKIGMIYVVSGDSATSISYFREAGTKFDRVLDTMRVSNNDYDITIMNKAAALILLGDAKEGQSIMAHLYETTKKQQIKNLLEDVMHKSRKEMIAGMTFNK